MKKIVICFICFFSTNLFAQVYVYGGLGVTQLQTDATAAANQVNSTDTPIVSDTFTRFDTSKVSKNLSLGYSFNKSLSIEVGYANLGSYQQALTGTYANGSTASYAPNSQISAYRINGVYTYSFEKIADLLFKFGVSQTSNKVSTYLSAPVGPSFTTRVTKPFIGIAASKDITDNVFVRLDWDRYYTNFNYGPDYTDNPSPTYYGRDVQTQVTPIDNFYFSVGYRF
jgi:hypothetical protein